MKHPETKFEYMKFHHLRPAYEEGMKVIESMNFSTPTLINQYPAFIGHLTLSRFLALYEAYKMVLNIAGHIAEVGMDMGTTSLYFAKLAKIYEPNTNTLVHGFDWFKGANPTNEERYIKKGDYKADFKIVTKLIASQGMQHSVHVHNLDASKDLENFFKENPHLQFKLVFIDCGIYSVVSSSLKHFWSRLTPGGMLLLDHYSFELAPGEIRAVRDILPKVKFMQFPFAWMPCAYAIKE